MDGKTLSGGEVVNKIFQLFKTKNGRHIELGKKLYVNIHEESDQHRVDYGVFAYESMIVFNSSDITKQLMSMGKRHKGYLVDEYDCDLFFSQLACPILANNDEVQYCAEMHIMNNVELKNSILIAYRNGDLKVNKINGEFRMRLQNLIDENQMQPEFKNQVKKIGVQPISSQNTEYSSSLPELLFEQLHAILR